MMSRNLSLALASLLVLVGLAASQRTLPKIPVVDFTRETTLDAKGLQQFAPFSVECERCKGEGTTVCEGCLEVDMPACTECTGKKRATCRLCDGTKKLHDPLAKRPCVYCEGSGWYDCALCNGFGDIKENAADGTSTSLPCGACKKVGRFVCKPCEGTGVMATVAIKKKPVTEASAEDLTEQKVALEAALKEFEAFQPLERASKTDKALEALVGKHRRTRPELADALALLFEVQKGLARAGAKYVNFPETQAFEYLLFRDRSIHLMRHDVRAIELCLARATHNETVAKSKK